MDLELSESKAGFLLNMYDTVINTLRSKLDSQTVEFRLFEQLEACIVVEEYPDEVSHTKFNGTQVPKCLTNKIDEIPFNVEGNSPYGFIQVKDIVCDAVSQEVEDKYSDTIGTKYEKDIGGNQVIKPLFGMESEAHIEVHLDNDTGGHISSETEKFKKLCSDIEVRGSMRNDDPPPVEVYCCENGGESKSNVAEIPEKLNSDFKVCGSMRKEDQLVPIDVCSVNGGDYISNVKLGSNLEVCGSMRKEKEWKRTLACKLYEERKTVDGSEEGMDSLWESYETDSSKINTKKNEKTTKKAEIEFYEDDDEEEEDMAGQICCLQALKFSTGKMNLGMRRPNLLRISKAMKGIGWFHHVSRRGKKM